MKKYLSLIGITALVLIVGRLWYQAFFAYLSEHTYYIYMLSSWQDRWVFISALVCSLIPIWYLFLSSKVNIRNLIISFIAWAWIFWIIHSNIKWDPIWIWHLITIFNTILLVSLWIYLILWLSALWSRIERKLIKFKQLRWQETLLSFWIWFCSFVVIVQILLWIWVLYWIVSWILFLWLWFMIRYEKEQLRKWWEIIWNILEEFKTWIMLWERDLNSKEFWTSNKVWLLVMLLPIILSVSYLYLWIQNAFTPYSTAWDANHEYMYIPKILAENAGIYRWNYVANNMPWFWHQFLTFIFSLTGCTNWWFGLSPDNIAISMNNISTTFVLIFWIAIIFQVFTLINKKEEETDGKKSSLKKSKNTITDPWVSNQNWITIWWYFLLLWLTGWMWAFLVIVDNKTDLWVMALSLLALLAGLIFLQNKNSSSDKKEILKYVIIAWLFFGFAALAKVTAFIDFALFGLLLIWLRFSPIMSLWLWIMIMWFARKFNILTSSVMLTNEIATRFIVIWWIITITWLIIFALKWKEFWKKIKDLFILWICFFIPIIIFKLPRTTISQININSYSFWNSLKSTFLSINTLNDKKSDNNRLLAQNLTDSNIYNSLLDSDAVNINNSKDNKTYQKSFTQCMKDWKIYSEDELNENLQEIIGWQWWEDFWRYIWYGWKEFNKTHIANVDKEMWNKNRFKLFKSIWPKSNECNWLKNNKNTICEKNLAYGIMKLLRPSSETCYGFNHDAKVLCNNADVIDNFKIDNLRWIYENWINNKDWEAWLLLKEAIDAYDKAKSEWKIWYSNYDLFYSEIVNLRQYYQSHSILSTDDAIYIPYRYLVPLNISFNWSLQNLSSYYTDIGFFWIIIYVFLLIALPYAIIKKDKILTSIVLTTLIWWWIRWIIWSSILWYWTVLISWTMISITLFWDKILRKDKNNFYKIVSWILIVLIWVIFWIQIIFNFLRISSQWANSAFVWYKWNVGKEQIIDKNLEIETKIKRWYTRKDIFDLQFPQYNIIINALANRSKENWVIIAWTYIQYFLWNQWNIKSDSMLLNFWRKTSDWDLCKTYRRLKDENTHYLIIDPNIGTVIMWEGNETLFYRFFGKLNSNESNIEIDGIVTTLIRLYKAWYLKLLSTNNLWSRYAFTLDDKTIKNYFWEDLTNEELILTRWKMAVLQYFDDASSVFWSITKIFMSRIINDAKSWIEDIASIYWLEVDAGKVANVAYSYMNWRVSEWFANDLTQDERNVLLSYLNIYYIVQSWNTSQIQDLLLSSVTWWSQIIALELN